MTPYMRKFFFACITLIILSCNDRQQAKTSDSDSTAKENNTTAAIIPPEQKKAEEPIAVVDTGQTWFRVMITKNDSDFMDYEGSWPMLLTANNFATLQLSRSKNIMSVSDILTFYIYGLSVGTKPIVTNAGKTGEVSMIMSPVKDGVYGLPIIPEKGSFTITKHDSTRISGNYEGEVVIEQKDIYKFRGAFLNVKFNK
jgi:hypothetical protein